MVLIYILLIYCPFAEILFGDFNLEILEELRYERVSHQISFDLVKNDWN